jgi:hypothetical protein
MKDGARLLVSRIAVVLFVAIMLLAISLRDTQYIIGGVVPGIVQIICGPRAYRWIGIFTAVSSVWVIFFIAGL